MALILNIDTSTEFASLALSNNKEILAYQENREQKNHGAFLQPAIQTICEESKTALNAIDAIAVTYGPGSYTGLRVGLASAKGLCYALNKPLITINTLEAMAMAVISKTTNTTNTLFCPMIDARRMEVFTALYDASLNEVLQPTAMIIDENSFSQQLTANQIIFSGNGHSKLKTLLKNSDAIFGETELNAANLPLLSEQMFENKQFANLAYVEPLYLKEFFNLSKNLK